MERVFSPLTTNNQRINGISAGCIVFLLLGRTYHTPYFLSPGNYSIHISAIKFHRLHGQYPPIPTPTLDKSSKNEGLDFFSLIPSFIRHPQAHVVWLVFRLGSTIQQFVVMEGLPQNKLASPGIYKPSVGYADLPKDRRSPREGTSPGICETIQGRCRLFVFLPIHVRNKCICVFL